MGVFLFTFLFCGLVNKPDVAMLIGLGIGAIVMTFGLLYHGDEVDDEAGLSAAAEEMVQAMKDGDASSLKSALLSFLQMANDRMERESVPQSENE